METIFIDSNDYSVIKPKRVASNRPMIRVGYHSNITKDALSLYINRALDRLIDENCTHCRLTFDGHTLRLEFGVGQLYYTRKNCNKSIWLGKSLSDALSPYIANGRYNASVNVAGNVVEVQIR